MRIVVIASDRLNPFAAALTAALAAEGRRPVGLLCAEPPAAVRLVQALRDWGLRESWRRMAARSRAAAGSPGNPRFHLAEWAARRSLAGWDRPLPRQCRNLGIPFRRVPSVNHPAAAAFARGCRPDLLLNAGGEIFRRAILEVPAAGVLNAHMGRLPAFRGMNVMEWSLLSGRAIGVTLHFVEAGIDTGDILAFVPMEIRRGDTLETLRARSFAVSLEGMLRCVEQLEAGTAVRTPQRPGEGRQYFVMHPRLRRIVEARVSAAACR